VLNDTEVKPPYGLENCIGPEKTANYIKTIVSIQLVVRELFKKIQETIGEHLRKILKYAERLIYI